MPIPQEMVERARGLAAHLGQTQPMRRGSVSERYVKCSKPGCGCATDPTARHGPYFSWTRKVGKAPQSRFLSAEQAQLVKQQIQTGRASCRDLEVFWELCEQRADGQRKPLDTDSPQVSRKGAPSVVRRRDRGKNRSPHRVRLG